MSSQQQSLFGFPEQSTPNTQGVKYTGSKLKLLPYIISLLPGLNVTTILDGFSGTTRVSQAFSQLGFQVISNDTALLSKVFATAFLTNKKDPKKYQDLINHLNALKGYAGWFTKYYGGQDFNGSAVQADGKKRPFQIHNTMKLDAIRDEIDTLQLPEIDRCVALVSLILALDKVDSTLGHFVSYLKNWSPRSYKNMQLEVPAISINAQDNQVFQDDIFQTLKVVACDLAYFDPPYGSNNEKMPPSRVRYNAYYHFWTTVIKNDKPSLFGSANRREDSSDKVSTSVFEEFRKNGHGQFLAVGSIEKLIHNTQSNYIILSYSTGGRATAKELREVIADCATLVKTLAIDYKKNVMADMKWTHQWSADANANQELLFVLKKR